MSLRERISRNTHGVFPGRARARCLMAFFRMSFPNPGERSRVKVERTVQKGRNGLACGQAGSRRTSYAFVNSLWDFSVPVTKPSGLARGMWPAYNCPRNKERIDGPARSHAAEAKFQRSGGKKSWSARYLVSPICALMSATRVSPYFLSLPFFYQLLFVIYGKEGTRLAGLERGVLFAVESNICTWRDERELSQTRTSPRRRFSLRPTSALFFEVSVCISVGRLASLSAISEFFRNFFHFPLFLRRAKHETTATVPDEHAQTTNCTPSVVC